MLSGAGHRWYVSFCCLSAVSRFAFVIALLLFVSGQPLRICHLFAALVHALQLSAFCRSFQRFAVVCRFCARFGSGSYVFMCVHVSS